MEFDEIWWDESEEKEEKEGKSNCCALPPIPLVKAFCSHSYPCPSPPSCPIPFFPPHTLEAATQTPITLSVTCSPIAIVPTALSLSLSHSYPSLPCPLPSSSSPLLQVADVVLCQSMSADGTTKKRLVIMDEVDGMGGSDRGGIPELIKVRATLRRREE